MPLRLPPRMMKILGRVRVRELGSGLGKRKGWVVGGRGKGGWRRGRGRGGVG